MAVILIMAHIKKEKKEKNCPLLGEIERVSLKK